MFGRTRPLVRSRGSRSGWARPVILLVLILGAGFALSFLGLRQFMDVEDAGRIPKKHKLVYVLGMHHSMTSVATKLLVSTGAFFAGEREELLIRRDNDMKYWELRKAVKANQKYFDRTRWMHNSRSKHLYSWLGYGTDLAKHPEKTTDLASDVDAILSDLISRTPADQVTIVKDPRMSLTTQVWLDQALRKGDTEVVCILLVRDPLESAYRFLADYNSAGSFLTLKQWGSLWEQYTWTPLKSCSSTGVKVILSKHEDFALDPLKATVDLARSVLRAVRSDRSLDVSSMNIPGDWSKKHAKKMTSWKTTIDNLPLRDYDILSSQGLALSRNILHNDLEGSVRQVLTQPKPEWVPIIFEEAKVYYVRLQSPLPSVDDSLKVLHRSLTCFDTSRNFVASLSPNNQPSLPGWDLIECSNDINCEALVRKQYGDDVVTLDVESLVTGFLADDSGLSILQCAPINECPNQRMFEAFLSIGGRTSEA